MKKQYVVIVVIIIILMAVLLGVYKIGNSVMFNDKWNATILREHNKLVEIIENEPNITNKNQQIDFFSINMITI